jgi:hypothetical protein
MLHALDEMVPSVNAEINQQPRVKNNFPRLTCAIGFDEKAGPYQVGCFRLLLVTISLPPSCSCQASIPLPDERLFRSKQVGYSRFSG